MARLGSWRPMLEPVCSSPQHAPLPASRTTRGDPPRSTTSPAFEAGFRRAPAGDLADHHACARCRRSRTRSARSSASGRSARSTSSRTRSTRCRSADATPEIQAIEETLAPLMAAHDDAIRLDAQLYWRVEPVHAPARRPRARRRAAVPRRAAPPRDDAVPAPASTTRRRRASPTLNQRLSTLTTTFEKNLLADTNDLAVVVRRCRRSSTASPSGELSARRRRRPPSEASTADYLVDAHPVHRPPVPLAASRTASMPRAHHGRPHALAASRDNANDNRPCCSRSSGCAPSAPRSSGYPSHAAYVTADETAGTPEAVARPAAPARRARRRATRAPSRRGAAGDRRRASRSRSRSRRTTGRSTPRRCAPREYDIDTSRAAPVVRGRAGAARRRLLRRDRSCTACTFTERARPARLPPGRPGLRGARRRRLRRSACSSSTSTRATRSAAARG